MFLLFRLSVTCRQKKFWIEYSYSHVLSQLSNSYGTLILQMPPLIARW